MRLIRYGENEWLVGDEATEVLMAYAVALSKVSVADSVDIAALTLEGHPVDVSLLIGPATMMANEHHDASYPEPDNQEVIAHLRERTERLVQRPTVQPSDDFPRFDDL